MKKIFLSILFFAFISISAFSVTVDLLGSINFNYTNVTGKAESYTGNMLDYEIAFNGGGINFGVDVLFLKHLGLYTRLGLYDVSNIKYNIAGINSTRKGKYTDYSSSFELGAVIPFLINNHLSVNIAPAFSMNYTDYKYTDYSKVETALDSVLGLGVSTDIYLKFRYKHFMAAAGVCGSFSPLCFVTSKNSNIEYYSNIKDCFAFNIRPYIGAGVSL